MKKHEATISTAGSSCKRTRGDFFREGPLTLADALVSHRVFDRAGGCVNDKPASLPDTALYRLTCQLGRGRNCAWRKRTRMSGMRRPKRSMM